MSTTVATQRVEQPEPVQASHAEEARAEFYRRLSSNQERARQLLRPGVSMVGEFILEKRAEVRREELEWTKGS